MVSNNISEWILRSLFWENIDRETEEKKATLRYVGILKIGMIRLKLR